MAQRLFCFSFSTFYFILNGQLKVYTSNNINQYNPIDYFIHVSPNGAHIMYV